MCWCSLWSGWPNTLATALGRDILSSGCYSQKSQWCQRPFFHHVVGPNLRPLQIIWWQPCWWIGPAVRFKAIVITENDVWHGGWNWTAQVGFPFSQQTSPIVNKSNAGHICPSSFIEDHIYCNKDWHHQIPAVLSWNLQLLGLPGVL